MNISSLAERRNEYIGKHVERTQIFCQLLVQELRNESAYDNVITDTYIRNIYHAASLYDVGKIGIPDQILLKKGRLEPEEFEIMKTHVDIGKSALIEALDKDPQNEVIKLSIEVTAFHHEKWDGSGYPEGLCGLDIPLSARVMALVDVYNALRAKRPYKEPLSHAQSVKTIKEDEGIHFDPSVVKAFSKIESKIEKIFETAIGEEPK